MGTVHSALRKIKEARLSAFGCSCEDVEMGHFVAGSPPAIGVNAA